MCFIRTLSLLTFFSFFWMIHPTFAKDISAQKAAEHAISNNLKEPPADEDGRIPTLNKMGAMSAQLDDISSEFIEHAKLPGAKVLEIGAAYGRACCAALKAGAMDYAANDMNLQHLQILARNVKKQNPKDLKKLNLKHGAFPTEVPLKKNSYDAILIARVIHFMNPKEVAETLKAAYNALKPGGKIYALMLSPYVRPYRAFIPVFEERVKSGNPFPGYVEDDAIYIDQSHLTGYMKKELNQEKEETTGIPFFFFDQDTAERMFRDAGFIDILAKSMASDYKSAIWELDGRENTGVIAMKPLESKARRNSNSD